MEYSVNDGNNYTETTGTITGVETGTTVLVRLTDGRNAGNTASIIVEDTIAPTLTVTIDYEENDKIPVSVAVVENESGVNKVKYASETITEANAKTYFASNGTEVSDTSFTIPRGNGTYTIYVEDYAGNFSIKELQITEKLYALYTSTDTTLTFLKTHKTPTTNSKIRGQTIAGVYTGFDTAKYTAQSQVPWYSNRASITKVVVEDEIKPVSTAYWFYECSSLELTKLNTSNVTSMKYMFGYTGNATSVTNFKITGTDNWNTAKVTDMSYMFREAGKNATTWDIGKLTTWQVGKVTTLYRFLYDTGTNATVWDIGNLDNWDTSNVTSLYYTFGNAGKNASTWNIGNISKWNTSKVKDCAAMFSNVARNVAEFNIGNLNTKEVTRADGTKYTAWDVGNVSSFSNTFGYAGTNASTWYIGELSNWDTSNITAARWAFQMTGQNCKTWTIGDISKWNVSKINSFHNMFLGAGQRATSFSLGNLATKEVTKADGTKYTAWDVNAGGATIFCSMFEQAGRDSSSWTIGDISNWNMTNATDIAAMFCNIANNVPYTTVFSLGDLSKWNTANVTNMTKTFSTVAYKSNWKLDLSGWDVGKVTDYTDFNKNVASKVTPPNFK